MSALRIRLRSSQRRTSVTKDPVQVHNVTSTGNDPSLLRHPQQSAAAKSMMKKRELLKQDPVAWAEYKAKEAERQRIRRKNRMESQVLRDRETGAARMKKYYNKCKNRATEDLNVQKTKNKVLTRNEKTRQKKYWRERQAICRAKKTSQKKVWDKVKDRERKRASRLKKKQKPPKTPSPGNPHKVHYTESAKRKAISRLWSKLPSNPDKFAEIVGDFLTSRKLTPRKEAALQERGVMKSSLRGRRLDFRDLAWEKLKGNLGQLKKRHDDVSRMQRRTILASLLIEKKYRLQRKFARELGVRRSFVRNVEQHQERITEQPGRLRKKRSDVTCMNVMESILEAYRSPEISRELPTMRTVKKDQCQRRVMEATVAKAYEIWKSNRSNTTASASVSLSVFQKLRPADVLLLRKTRLNQCLCEICTDIMLKLRTLNKVASLYNRPDCKLTDKYALIAATMCPKDDNSENFKLKCIYRNCDDCGVKLLHARLHDTLVEACGDREVGWQKWTRKQYIHEGKTKSKKAITCKVGTLDEFLQELENEMVDFARHIFVANWQQKMYSQIVHNPPDHSVTMVLDFAENYSCINQDEIQDAHWSLDQVTIHPIVVSYLCPEHKDHVVQEAVVIISNDLKHDSHAVQHFTELTVKHLREKRGLVINRIIEFSDGCAVQYKSKLPFSYITFAKQFLGAKLERHFFGSRHGKGPSDGVSGVVKSVVRRAVISRQAVVNSAETMFAYCEANLKRGDCRKQRRTFIFVPNGDIERDRTEIKVKSAVAGTRLLHGVKDVEPGLIAVRLLSCFCDGCEGLQDDCQNSAYVQPWQNRVLSLVTPPTIDVAAVQSIPEDDGGEEGEEHEVKDIQELWKTLTEGVISEEQGDDCDYDVMDVSDGLLESVSHLLEESCGFLPNVHDTKDEVPEAAIQGGLTLHNPGDVNPEIAMIHDVQAVHYLNGNVMPAEVATIHDNQTLVDLGNDEPAKSSLQMPVRDASNEYGKFLERARLLWKPVIED